jgi:hypothetical protein
METTNFIKADGKPKPFHLGIFYGTGARLSFLIQFHSPNWIWLTDQQLLFVKVKSNALLIHSLMNRLFR